MVNLKEELIEEIKEEVKDEVREEVKEEIKKVQENRPTLVFVSILLFVALFGIFYQTVPHDRLIYWLIPAIFEAWTILNHRKADTISEAIWELSARPIVPWLFGALTVYGLWQIPGITILEFGVWLAMQGHFFWQANKE